MRFFFGILLFLYNISKYKGYEASMCTGLHIDLAVLDEFFPTGLQHVFKYSTDLILTVADESHTTLTFTNESIWSWDKILNQSSPIRFSNDIEIVQCPQFFPCNIKILDSLGLLQIPLSNGLNPILNKNLFFDQGTAFLINSQNYQHIFFDKNSPCVYTDGSSTFSKTNVDSFLGMKHATTVKYCCTQFKDFSVPNTQLTCQRIRGNTIFSEKNGIQLAHFSYSVGYIVEDDTPNEVTANYLQPGTRFMALLNYDAINNCDFYSPSSKTCSIDLPFQDDADIQVNLQLSLINDNITSVTPLQYGPVIAAKIIFQNGFFIKDKNELYTLNDPCWNRTFTVQNGITTKNSLCCSQFVKTICGSYQSTTNVSDSNVNIYLVLTYLFTDTSFILTINNYDANQTSSITVKSFSHDTSTQICEASTAFPKNTCQLKLSKTQTYDITFSTNVTTKDYSVSTIIYNGTEVTSPHVVPRNPCYTFTSQFTYTSFCCLA